MNSYKATVAAVPGGTETTVTVTGRMTIEHAADLKDALLRGLRTSEVLRLDLEGVEEIDVIGLQLLCSLHRSATAAGKRLHVAWSGTAVAAAKAAAGFREKARCAGEAVTTCVWREKE